MKKLFRKISAFLLAAILIVSALSFTAFAADSTITYKGGESGFGFAPGSEYTATDLFDNFKDVMPGDELQEFIEIKNEAESCDYIKVYMRAEVHDENGNPLTYSEVFENTDGKDQEKIEGERDETVATMQDFLSQLTMRIYNSETLIYEASPDEAGALIKNVFLGELKQERSLTLKVELDVPIELGNKYANRVGEVDWVFTVEEYNKPKNPDDSYDPSPSDKPDKDPSTTTPDVPVDVVEQLNPEAPQVLPNVPKTGDDTVVWPYVTLLGIGIIGMVLTAFKKRKKG